MEGIKKRMHEPLMGNVDDGVAVHVCGVRQKSLYLLLNLKNNFIYFWLGWVFVTAWAFSYCGDRELLSVAVCGLLLAVASRDADHGLYGMWTSIVSPHGLSSHGSQALEHKLSRCGISMWNLPSQGLNPALAGRFFTTEPPEKACSIFLY